MKSKRIAIQLPLPSISLQKFLEKLLKEDDFFSLALENPLDAAKECGLNLEIKSFTPTDFANFFGAVAGLKELLKDTDKKELNFEDIFGNPAEIRGSILDAERHQGFFKEWDNKDAFRDKEICRTTNRYFERDRGMKSQKMIKITQIRSIEHTQLITPVIMYRIETQRDILSRTMESAKTNNHTVTEWNTDRMMQSNTESERGVDTTFEKDGRSITEDLLQGPLINPVDLASVSARLETFTQIIGAENLSHKKKGRK